MKHIATYIIACSVAALLLLACNPVSQTIEANRQVGSDGSADARVEPASETRTPSVLHIEVATETPIYIPAVIVDTEEAPPYETIQSTLTTLHVEDFRDEKQITPPQLRLFLDWLKDKKVEWEGWVAGMVPDNDAHTTYHVNIQMEEPQLGVIGDVSVTLWNVPFEQASQLEMWPDMANTTESWQHVRFSGTIDAVTIWRNVLINSQNIEPLP